MVHRPDGIGAFEFAVRASLRAAQLCRGCLPRIEGGHTVAVTAQMEVAGGTLAAESDPAVQDEILSELPVAAVPA